MLVLIRIEWQVDCFLGRPENFRDFQRSLGFFFYILLEFITHKVFLFVLTDDLCLVKGFLVIFIMLPQLRFPELSK